MVSNAAGRVHNRQGRVSNAYGEVMNLQGAVASLGGRVYNDRGSVAARNARVQNFSGFVDNSDGLVSPRPAPPRPPLSLRIDVPLRSDTRGRVESPPPHAHPRCANPLAAQVENWGGFVRNSLAADAGAAQSPSPLSSLAISPPPRPPQFAALPHSPAETPRHVPAPTPPLAGAILGSNPGTPRAESMSAGPMTPGAARTRPAPPPRRAARPPLAVSVTRRCAAGVTTSGVTPVLSRASFRGASAPTPHRVPLTAPAELEIYRRSGGSATPSWHGHSTARDPAPPTAPRPSF